MASLAFRDLKDMSGPFEGTDRYGNAFYKLELGELGRIPVYLCWTSDKEVRSPYLGEGWSIPFLESRIVPVSEKTLRMHQPDGFVRYFHKEGDVYVGGRIWSAVRKGDAIKVTADPKDGLPKSEFTFSRGRLVKMDCEEGSFTFRNDANGISVRGAGKTLSIARRNNDANQLDLVAPSGRWHGSCREENGEFRLVALKNPAGEELKFSYGYGQGDSHRIFSDGTTKIVWDPYTGKIVAKDGCRFYVADAGRSPAALPRISRWNAEGTEESYQRDVVKGVETVVDGSGVKTVTKRFTSGDLAGRIRSVERFVGGVSQGAEKYIYDSKGRLVDKIPSK